MEKELLSVKEFYRNKSIFITGATGFVGKYIVYKLLKSCDVNRIYFLLRSKKGYSASQRYDQYLKSKTFADIDEKQMRSKLIALEGDITKPNLGLCDEDYQSIVEHVSIIINSGASIKYNDSLRDSSRSNVISTAGIIKLSEEMKKLQVLVHISTFAVFMPQRIMREKIYSLPFDAPKFLVDTEQLDEKQLNLIYGDYVTDYINTYHLTKTVAETLLNIKCKTIPLVIVRPSVVMPAYKEPEPGWFQGMQLSTGLIAIWTAGLIRTIMKHDDFGAPVIPVDMLGNCVIVAASRQANVMSNDITIYNCTTNCENSPTMGTLAYFYGDCAEKYPSNKVFRTPLKYVPMASNRIVYEVKKFTHHTLFAYFADSLLRLKGEKPIVVDITRKLNVYLDVIEKEVRRNKIFETDNFQNLYTSLNENEKEDFNFNLDSIDWRMHSFHHYMNYRQRILKESENDIPRALSHMKRIYVIKATVKLGFGLTIAYLLYRNIRHTFRIPNFK